MTSPDISLKFTFSVFRDELQPCRGRHPIPRRERQGRPDSLQRKGKYYRQCLLYNTLHLQPDTILLIVKLIMLKMMQ